MYIDKGVAKFSHFCFRCNFPHTWDLHTEGEVLSMYTSGVGCGHRLFVRHDKTEHELAEEKSHEDHEPEAA